MSFLDRLKGMFGRSKGKAQVAAGDVADKKATSTKVESGTDTADTRDSTTS